jgi:hypothetical protein
MFGIKKLRRRILEVEQALHHRYTRPSHATISIPVVDAKGKPVTGSPYGFRSPAYYELPLAEAIETLQKALGVELQLVQGTKDTVKATEIIKIQKRGK